MRNILFAVFMVTLLPTPVNAAEPLSLAKPAYGESKSLPVKMKSSHNPCANYGAGFAQVPGTDTCAKVGGALSVDVGASGRGR